MNDSERVAHTLQELKPGTEVELELHDGSTIAGTVASVEDGVVRLEGDNQVSSDDVDDVVVVVSSEGLE